MVRQRESAPDTVATRALKTLDLRSTAVMVPLGQLGKRLQAALTALCQKSLPLVAVCFSHFMLDIPHREWTIFGVSRDSSIGQPCVVIADLWRMLPFSPPHLFP